MTLEAWLMHDTSHDLSLAKYAIDKLREAWDNKKELSQKDKKLVIEWLEDSNTGLKKKLDTYYTKVKEQKK